MPSGWGKGFVLQVGVWMLERGFSDDPLGCDVRTVSPGAVGMVISCPVLPGLGMGSVSSLAYLPEKMYSSISRMSI